MVKMQLRRSTFHLSVTEYVDILLSHIAVQTVWIYAFSQRSGTLQIWFGQKDGFG
jgi:hypothetical protein